MKFNPNISRSMGIFLNFIVGNLCYKTVPGFFATLLILLPLLSGQPSIETHITGVYQGKTLFIQNPFDPVSKAFCIQSVYVNGRKMGGRSQLSAIKLDFEGIDMYTPVSIKIIQKDSCNPIVINPDAIFFHSTFSFRELVLSDTSLVWRTVGDKGGGSYLVEKYQGGLWLEEDTVESKGKFEGAEYVYYPDFEEGANKYRIKYIFPNGNYLYSYELDLHFYPDPVTFTPKATSTFLNLSRPASYDIYDAGGELVMNGKGSQVDVSGLPKGDYVIYFDGKDPTLFTRK